MIASGADWVKVFGSTGGFDDLTQFQTFTFEEMKAAVEGDPLADITAVSNRDHIRWVMKAGQVVVDKTTRR